MSVEAFRSELLANVPHGFLSKGEMWGLNVGYGSGDDPQLIAENRRRAIEAVLPGAELATVHQVHSPTVVRVERPWEQDQRPHADAMVTDYSSRQTVLQRPSRFVTEVPPDLYEIWSLEEEVATTPALARSSWP